MLDNRLKAKLDEGRTVLGCFFRYTDPTLAEFVAMAGWDFLVFDGEHGPLEPRDVEGLSRAAELRGATPIGRVPTNSPPAILRFLDTGVHGVHVPWVNSAAEAEAVVQAVKYLPEGSRGLANSRASDFGWSEPLDAYTARANRETLVVVHIETRAAVDQIDDYLAVDGVDVLFVGPTDLSHSLGQPGRIDHPDVVAAIERVADAVAGSSKVFGVYAATPELVKRWSARGARYMTTGVEGVLRPGMRAYLESIDD